MKKGETTEFMEAQENMKKIFAKIQQNSILQHTYADMQNGNTADQSVSAQLVQLAMTLDSYMKKVKDMTL